MNNYRTYNEKKNKVIICHNGTFYNISLSLVLCGSWSGHKDEQVLLEACGGKDVDLKLIPTKTTKYTQPLDVYFFMQYKTYAKRISDFIKLRSITDSLSWNCILSFTINYLQKHIDQCFFRHGRTLDTILWTCGQLHRCH